MISVHTLPCDSGDGTHFTQFPGHRQLHLYTDVHFDTLHTHCHSHFVVHIFSQGTYILEDALRTDGTVHIEHHTHSVLSLSHVLEVDIGVH